MAGCSGSGPGPDSPASCYLLEHDGFRLVLDLGNGALGALSRHVDVRTIDTLVLSHLHADHCLDTSPLVVAHRYHPAGPAPRIPVLAPVGAHRRLTAAYDGGPDLADVFGFADLSAGEREVGPFRLRSARMAHPVETYAVRVSAGGRSLTYSADTGASPGLVELARGSDVLLCEASFTAPVGAEPLNPPDLHLSGREAGEHARAAGVGRLLVTHVPMWTSRERVLTEAGGICPGAELVHSGATYDI